MMESDRLVCEFCCLDRWWVISCWIHLWISAPVYSLTLFLFLVSFTTSPWWTGTWAAYFNCKLQIYRLTSLHHFFFLVGATLTSIIPQQTSSRVIRKAASADNWLFSCFNEDSELVEYLVPDVTHVYASGSDKAGREGGGVKQDDSSRSALTVAVNDLISSSGTPVITNDTWAEGIQMPYTASLGIILLSGVRAVTLVPLNRFVDDGT